MPENVKASEIEHVLDLLAWMMDDVTYYPNKETAVAAMNAARAELASLRAKAERAVDCERLNRIVTNIEVHLANIEPCPHPHCLLQSHLTTFLKQDGRGLDIEQEPPHA